MRKYVFEVIDEDFSTVYTELFGNCSDQSRGCPAGFGCQIWKQKLQCFLHKLRTHQKSNTSLSALGETKAASTGKFYHRKMKHSRLKIGSSQGSQIHWLFQTIHQGLLPCAVQPPASASHCYYLVCCSEEFAGLCAVTPQVTKGHKKKKKKLSNVIIFHSFPVT